MRTTLHTAFAAAALAMAMPAFGQITFYEREGFRGSEHTTQGALDNFAGWGFNRRASSVVVVKGRWEVCEGIGFKGRCAVLRPGRYDRLSTMGLNDRLSSARPVNTRTKYATEAQPPTYHANDDYGQHPNGGPSR